MADDLEVELAAHTGRQTSKLTLALAAAVVLVAGVLIGIQGQKALGSTASGPQAQQPQARQQQGYGQMPGQGQAFGNRQGGARGDMTMGTIEKIDGATITVKTMDGTSVVVSTTDATKVTVSAEGKVADLKTGGQIVVQGAKGADGSVAATTVTQGGGLR